MCGLGHLPRVAYVSNSPEAQPALKIKSSAFSRYYMAQLLSAHAYHAIGAGCLGSKSRAGQIGSVSPTARHH